MNNRQERAALPWLAGQRPLMLAPMQGLTNRALRDFFIEKVRPDVVFTEFMRVNSKSGKVISPADRLEATATRDGVPLVVQLIGNDIDALVKAAEIVQELGAEHLNINLGCPYSRSGKGIGGAMLKDPAGLARTLAALRGRITGSFSVKVRAGFEDAGEIFSLLTMFEDQGIDFLILHPRTVAARYAGRADHGVTAEVVARTKLPVIANGDVFTAEQARRVLAQSGAAGLMLGRGAISDPYLFSRIRGQYPDHSPTDQRLAELREYLSALLARYEQIFAGDRQVLSKMKEVLGQINDPEFATARKKLLKCKYLDKFSEILAAAAG